MGLLIFMFALSHDLLGLLNTTIVLNSLFSWITLQYLNYYIVHSFQTDLCYLNTFFFIIWYLGKFMKVVELVNPGKLQGLSWGILVEGFLSAHHHDHEIILLSVVQKELSKTDCWVKGAYIDGIQYVHPCKLLNWYAYCMVTWSWSVFWSRIKLLTGSSHFSCVKMT